MRVYVVLGGYSYSYDSDWVLGVTNDICAAKTIAQEYVGDGLLEWKEGSHNTAPTEPGESIWALTINIPGASFDAITIQRWDVTP